MTFKLIHAAPALVLALALSTAHAQTSPARIGTVKQVQGEVVITNGAAKRNASPGAAVMEAESVQAGPNAGASLLMRDGTVVGVGAQSTVDLTRFRFDGTTQQGEFAIRLLRGTMRMVTGLLARTSPAQVSVSTPTATIGIRGTDFIVEAE